jgi:hypothetical protein
MDGTLEPDEGVYEEKTRNNWVGNGENGTASEGRLDGTLESERDIRGYYLEIGALESNRGIRANNTDGSGGNGLVGWDEEIEGWMTQHGGRENAMEGTRRSRGFGETMG